MRVTRVEWFTVFLIAACYGAVVTSTTFLAEISLSVAILATGGAIALYSSLQHEVIHGHPTDNQRLNEALVFPALNIAIPYQRFRDTHLAHHKDAMLTDPFDDPESNYLDPGQWEGLPLWLRRVLSLNNTLLGRMILGPAIGQAIFLRDEIRMIRAGSPSVRRAWALWLAGLVPVTLWLILVSTMPVWAFLLATYLGLSLLRIRTFLEHQAHEKTRARTVVIEDRGILAFLFLNNNFHVVHHMHPRVPWYKLPALYRARRPRYLACNEHYVYRSYGEVMRRYLLRAKDPVAHPLWRRRG